MTNKVMRFLTEQMDETEEPCCKYSSSFTYEELQVSEQEMIALFTTKCSQGLGAKWKGLIVVPEASVADHIYNILKDALYFTIESSVAKIIRTNSSTIVVKWHSGEELRVEACYMAKCMHHLRGTQYSFLGLIEPGLLSERTLLVAKALLRPLDGDNVTIYEA